MKSFFSDQNIARYKKLASGTLTVLERKTIIEKLAQEGAHFRDHWNARVEGMHVKADKGRLVQFVLKLP